MAIKAGIFQRGRGKQNGLSKRRRPHAIEEYRAKDDFVLCRCGMQGTAAEYTRHSLDMKTTGMRLRSLEQLSELPAARFDYPTQGRVQL